MTTGLTRRRFMVGAAGLGLVAGCAMPAVRAPWSPPSPMRVPKIGFLFGNRSGDPVTISAVQAFREGLAEHGYSEDQDIAIEWRFAEAQPHALPILATELAQLPVEMIVAVGPPDIEAARDATTMIPIIMVQGDDPVGLGFIASLAHPGGRITGTSTLSTDLTAKRLQLLKEVAPGISRVVLLYDPSATSHLAQVREMDAVAKTLGMEIQVRGVRQPSDFEVAFQLAVAERADALVALQSGFTSAHIVQVVTFANANHLPAIYPFRAWVDAGGLMAYSGDRLGNFRRAAYYVDRILKGAKPTDLPVEQPMRFEFVVNLQTAQALGITFPNEIMLQVTEVLP